MASSVGLSTAPAEDRRRLDPIHGPAHNFWSLGFQFRLPGARRFALAGGSSPSRPQTTEAALLLWFGMECCFFGFRFFNQFADPLGKQRIKYPFCDLPIAIYHLSSSMHLSHMTATAFARVSCPSG
jgi:hypothetical protein